MSEPVKVPYGSKIDIASLLIAAAFLFASLALNLIPALFAGMITFILIHAFAPVVSRLANGSRGRLLAALLLAAIIVAAMVGLSLAASAFVRSETGLSALFQKMAQILDDASDTLPDSLASYLPNNAEEARQMTVEWLRTHSTEMRLFGAQAGKVFVHALIGLVIGALVAIHDIMPEESCKPLAAALRCRTRMFTRSFRQVVVAQIRISALNTFFTALYLMVVLPLCGVHLPLTKTMVLVAFIVGLLPVIGNLISNTVIFVVSLSHSLPIAVASLVFLIVIHKLEYFLNARIVGSRIHASAWELLLAMLMLETMFGIAGLAAAPVFYAYLKSELALRDLV
ncbi:AI-2E family transporter [Silvimonas amylolytica]|uniref:Membrane protein n=1 Tax=Silvimonas amylolytica TaxID=449663 RepID=A0ABQ2PLV4_9NEIS|nr:AI-2E family transporter [Silvimonas amylolytica]GGP26599.1 membrane protein [Silvimonas amylolytica]